MNTLLLLAALTSQITFQTATEGEMLTIIPQVMVTEPCLCQVQILTSRSGPGGQSTSRQQNTVSLPANQTVNLSRMTVNAGPNDNLSQQWPAS